MTSMVILFVFGTVIGSFLNVVGLRFNSGVSLGGRSHCPHCGQKLRSHELIPILSFLKSFGRCLTCKSKISWQYPTIELLTALIFVTIFRLDYPNTAKILFLITFCLYVVIIIYDFRHKIIPDLFSYCAVVIALITRSILGGGVMDWLAGPILFSSFASIWLLSRGRAMGFGDAKLSLSIGLLLGAKLAFSGIILAFWLGAIYGITAMILTHTSLLWHSRERVTMKSEVPFAPFIILASWISLILNLNILNVSFF